MKHFSTCNSILVFALAIFIAYSVEAQVTGSVKLTIMDSGGVSDTLRFGEIHGASSGLDVNLGEFELPPVPPAGAFDVRWVVSGVEGLSIDYRDTVNAQNKKNVWTLKLQPGSSGYPITITWDSTKLWNGFFQMYDAATGGSKVNIDMNRNGRVTIADNTVGSLTIVHTFTVSRSINLQSGWNLVSVPVGVKNWSTGDIFPSYVSAYSYSSGYQSASALAHGKGYWVNYPAVGIASLTGEPFASDTFSVVPGWNLIGSTYSTVSTAAIQQIPNSIITSYFFSYSSGYKQVNSITPGQGIWVKASQQGQIVLGSSALLKASDANLSVDDTTWNLIKFTDATGKSGELLFSSQARNIDRYDLPPRPPAGIFDVRFSRDRFAEVLPDTSSVLQIQLQAAQSPIKLEWKIRDGKSYLLNKMDTSPIVLIKSGSMSLSQHSNLGEMKIVAAYDASIIPTKFSLEQNYPNPFNPATTIRFNLKEPSSVSLIVFNTLGEKVMEQNYGSLKAGTYNKDINMGSFTSGMYFYRIIIQGSDGENFVSTRKLLLMK